ncbi:hypothetical protein [uncultured Negativibacillus sp.]|uniref:hypothetical protein n=1 Tax=uncultured Negativibacillus sp. TaxID=1980696 RepID=UPI0025D153B4|nr:hypothetical protein [uncultured Negativibacillus sp.]
MPAALYHALMAASVLMMLCSVAALILGRNRSQRFFTGWMLVFVGGFLIFLLIFRGKIAMC